jgi:pimeloyl-ACP methyl ester carboxylesterase
MRAVINDITLAYEDHGSGPAVLLIHGFPLCRLMWRPQIQALVAAGFRLILPDLRGFGETDAPAGPYSMEIFADDIIALLDTLGIEQAIIGGMSMGGYVLFNLLERYPQRLAGACFIVTRATADDDDGKARRLQLARDVQKFGPQVVADAFEQVLFSEDSLLKRPKLLAEAYGWMTANDTAGIAGGLLAMRERKDYTALLGRITVPALVIGAEEDKVAPPAIGRAIAEGIPGCALEIIRHGGHMVNLEEPGAFNETLLDFLRRIGHGQQ